MAETPMLRQYADKLEAATDALNLATAAVDKAKREKAYWQRRIAEEAGYGDRYDYRGEVPAIDRTAQFR